MDVTRQLLTSHTVASPDPLDSYDTVTRLQSSVSLRSYERPSSDRVEWKISGRRLREESNRTDLGQMVDGRLRTRPRYIQSEAIVFRDL
jgi:hypothetical protein